MKTEQLYFDDPLCLEFMAEVIGMTTTERGKYGVVLPKTYFYPTSGGQDHDTGKIGDAIVLDVYKMEDGRIIHTLDREITPGLYPASIDRMRRWQNMQAHTAQHILSRAFETELDLETLSANINADTPSTIALNIISSDQYDLLQVEDKANSIIFENRAVKNYYITDNEVSKIPFRKPPKVTGRIRVVEVDGYDYSACGGTHCPRTGMVGVLKILKSEIQNRKLRVYFVAGYQALKVFQNTYATIRELSNNLEIGQEELIMAVQRQTDNLQAVRSELDPGDPSQSTGGISLCGSKLDFNCKDSSR
jgi:alanyl-tRNA synthetase